MPCGKQGHDDDRGQGTERNELSGTQHRPGAHMGISAFFQPGQALEVVACAREEEIVDAIGDGKRQGSPDNGQDRPLHPVPRLVADERPQFPFAHLEPWREEDVAHGHRFRSGGVVGVHRDVVIRRARQANMRVFDPRVQQPYPCLRPRRSQLCQQRRVEGAAARRGLHAPWR